MIHCNSIDNRPEMMELNLVRRAKDSWTTKLDSIRNSPCNYYFRDDLPIEMSPNKEIKKLFKQYDLFGEIIIKDTSIRLNREHLPLILPRIDKYFNDVMKGI
jgi:hypothetical protein